MKIRKQFPHFDERKVVEREATGEKKAGSQRKNCIHKLH
jgi:hypothetical protein